MPMLSMPGMHVSSKLWPFAWWFFANLGEATGVEHGTVTMINWRCRLGVFLFYRAPHSLSFVPIVVSRFRFLFPLQMSTTAARASKQIRNGFCFTFLLLAINYYWRRAHKSKRPIKWISHEFSCFAWAVRLLSFHARPRHAMAPRNGPIQRIQRIQRTLMCMR